MEKTTREVKLYGRSRPCQGSPTGNKDVPWLNISGAWLEKLGFGIGDTVRITTCEKLLIIEPLEGGSKARQQYRSTLDQAGHIHKKLVP